jgi:mannose-6-phosphate isomerase-like protein (cupin superfamily)
MMTHGDITTITTAMTAAAYGGSDNENVAALVRCTADANAALIRGDISRYLALITHASDYTLLAPFGGEPARGFDHSDERLAALARFFRGGTAELELVQSYASRDLVVLVLIERQRCEIGSLPEQDWSLRVTQAYRRDGSEWRLVHRHADPLVQNIGLENAAEIARMGWMKPEEKAPLFEPIIAGPGSPAIAAAGTSLVVREWTDSGPSYMHVHRSDDEAWYVLEGSLRFRFPDREVDAPAGTTVLVPAGSPHTYRLTVPSRYLIFLTPRLDRLIARLHSLPHGADPRPTLAEFDTVVVE